MAPLPSRGDGEDRRERIRRLVADSDPVPAGALEPGSGAVRGTVEVHEGTVRGPLTDAECVLVEYERGRTGEGRYEPVEGRIESVPFLVDDGDGRVLVDPTDHGYGDGPLPISPGRTHRFEGDESGENVRRLDVDEAPTLPWVHAEASIRPGDEVYAVGTVSRATGAAPEDVEWTLGTGDATAEFVLTDLGRRTLYEELETESPLTGRFWRLAVLGLIAVAALLLTLSILVVTFLL